MMKKVILIISICAAAILSFTIAIPAANDKAAADTAKKLEEIPLPEQTQYIEKVSLAGKLAGCGNGMQYFGAILIKSELLLEELRTYYSDYADNEWECIVEHQPDRKIPVIEHGCLEFQTEINGDDYFRVYSWGSSSGIFAGLDLRGH